MCLNEIIQMKGFKITLQNNLLARKGVACHNFQNLKSKIESKFNLNKRFQIFTEDGTEVDEDEYLMNLPQNSLLIVSRYIFFTTIMFIHLIG